MSAKKRPASYGELDWPNRESNTTYLRNGFLNLISEIAQEALQGLYKGPFQIYMNQVKPLGLLWSDIVNTIDPPSEPVETLLSSLRDWADRWNLNADWCLEAAYETLRMWALLSKRPERFRFSSLGWGGVHVSNVPTPPEDWPEYDPLFMLRQRYLEKMLEVAKAAIADSVLNAGQLKRKRALIDSIVEKADSYCDEVEKQYLDQGCIRARAEESLLERNLRWTVQFQVLGRTFSDIAADTEVDTEVSTVTRSVNKLLTKLGLSRRPNSGRGRRKGSSNTKALKGIR